MTGPIQERDWKYLRNIHDELLNELCSRIIAKAVEIATAEKGNPHQRYLTLYRHFKKSDGIIAECFDDWRRSTISGRIICLRHYELLTDEHVKHMSEKAQEWLHMVEELGKY
jgi:hypothetical protein